MIQPIFLKGLSLGLSLLVFAACEVTKPYVVADTGKSIMIGRGEAEYGFTFGLKAERLAEEHCGKHGRSAQYSRKINSFLVIYDCVN